MRVQAVGMWFTQTLHAELKRGKNRAPSCSRRKQGCQGGRRKTRRRGPPGKEKSISQKKRGGPHPMLQRHLEYILQELRGLLLLWGALGQLAERREDRGAWGSVNSFQKIRSLEMWTHGQGRLWPFKNTIKKEKSSSGGMRHCRREAFSLTSPKFPTPTQSFFYAFLKSCILS